MPGSNEGHECWNELRLSYERSLGVIGKPQLPCVGKQPALTVARGLLSPLSQYPPRDATTHLTYNTLAIVGCTILPFTH